MSALSTKRPAVNILRWLVLERAEQAAHGAQYRRKVEPQYSKISGQPSAGNLTLTQDERRSRRRREGRDPRELWADRHSVFEFIEGRLGKNVFRDQFSFHLVRSIRNNAISQFLRQP